jgi:hypothetical protein
MGYSDNFAPAYTSQDVTPVNGRIDLLSSVPSSFQIQQPAVNNTSFAGEATTGQITETPLSRMYFSCQNIDALQEGIRYRIYVETDGKYTIGRQSDNELKIIMRSIYFQHARHDARPVVDQVRELNGHVLTWAVPEVLSNLRQYEVYRKDASTLPMPLERSPLATMKGTKTLEIKSFM